jgi:hypothetical protein
LPLEIDEGLVDLSLQRLSTFLDLRLVFEVEVCPAAD